jgi:hypothetical protein
MGCTPGFIQLLKQYGEGVFVPADYQRTFLTPTHCNAPMVQKWTLPSRSAKTFDATRHILIEPALGLPVTEDNG